MLQSLQLEKNQKPRIETKLPRRSKSRCLIWLISKNGICTRQTMKWEKSFSKLLKAKNWWKLCLQRKPKKIRRVDSVYSSHHFWLGRHSLLHFVFVNFELHEYWVFGWKRKITYFKSGWKRKQTSESFMRVCEPLHHHKRSQRMGGIFLQTFHAPNLRSFETAFHLDYLGPKQLRRFIPDGHFKMEAWGFLWDRQEVLW